MGRPFLFFSLFLFLEKIDLNASSEVDSLVLTGEQEQPHSAWASSLFQMSPGGPWCQFRGQCACGGGGKGREPIGRSSFFFLTFLTYKEH